MTQLPEYSYSFFREYIERFGDEFKNVSEKNRDNVYKFVQHNLYKRLDEAQSLGKLSESEHTQLMLIFNEIAIDKE